MTITKRQKRTARKLILPAIAIGLMTMMMYLDSRDRPQPAAGHRAAAAARLPHGLRVR